MRTIINDLIILGRAAPDLIHKNGRKTYCVAGYSPKYKFIRMYPTNVYCKQLKVWNIVKVPLERNPQDIRPESWRIQGSKKEWNRLEEKIEVVGKYPKKERRQLIYNLLDECRDDINEEKRSLGIIKPVKIEGLFEERKKLLEKKQLYLSDFIDVTPPRNHWVKTKSEYKYIPYIKYTCSDCKASQGYHRQQLLSIEAYEWMRKHPEKQDQLWDNYRIKDPEFDVYLFIGNQRLYFTSFMVISIFRFKKKNYPLKKMKPLSLVTKVEKFQT